MRRMCRGKLWALTWVALLVLPAAAGAQAQRVGTWVDGVVAVEEPSDAAAVRRLEANDLQAWFSATANPEIANRIRQSRTLRSAVSYGLYHELTFNPVGPVFPGTDRLNPFAVPRIREAMNWLVDRRHIAQEIMGGMGVPRWLPINTAFPDYARLADVARRLEIRYRHDPERARSVITEEMQKLGANLVGGRWQFRGRPVTITFLIRVEDERRQIGDYVAGLLEQLGFVVERRYGRAADLNPLWIVQDPAEGRWHVYTGGWISTVIDRDQADNFDFFYTKRGLARPLWQAYRPSPEFDRLSDRLNKRDFRSVGERARLMARALELALQDSVRLWLVERQSVWPWRAELELVGDLAGGLSGSFLWPYTVRFRGRAGGVVRIGVPSILPEPWNPIGGSNWIFDTTLYRATQDYPLIANPHTGLPERQRVERVEITVKQGLPVTKNSDWVQLRFAPTIRVPEDAIIGWDSRAQRFVTVREKHPQGLEALVKSTVYFEKDLFRKVQWHDGNRLSLGDILLGWILTFERADEHSPLFDRSYVPSFQSFMETFRGFRIVSEDPLVAEFYSTSWTMDAELMTAAGSFWPVYGFGPGPWHTVALGIRAEAAGRAAFTAAKAAEKKVERLNYVAGPTLAVLDRELEAARAENYIPFERALGRWIKPEEARQRWRLLAAWRAGRGHYWVGMGPFLLQRVSPVEKIVELRRFGRFPDPATKWLRFGEPRLASVSVVGPRQVTAGSEAAFEIRVAEADKPYPPQDLQEVKYLLFNARNELVAQGRAQRAGEVWRVLLGREVTSRLTPGSNRLEAVVVSKVVSVPSFASLTFTSLPAR
ncbi:MAG: ABC transporter substrate-binding protein [Armatimonadota bacterium]|nr:ABC transporter substrate-binding protein [Armatimonadota bacterium]MDR7393734.1 ABC transporter substrate-binding protein [Armatimonadota bacterium]MDR7395916.1 ABC transporter substrate-binding protein [Armatimonadota bacterium]MDR7398722.1 ABC transporter substrate-binding protein [Armatimonadota bacterium]MDR7407104.1 ABC transporter substrate-binding protein [Armatimonadota bacterium]